MEELINKYMCPGCLNGSGTTCGSYKPINGYGKFLTCSNHVAGTMAVGIGKILLGMPTGFNRVGPQKRENPYIYMGEKIEDLYLEKNDIFDFPLWKKKEDGKVFLKVVSPRINRIDIFVIDSDEGFDDIDCIDVTDIDME